MKKFVLNRNSTLRGATLAPAQMNMSDDKAKRPSPPAALNANFPTARASRSTIQSARKGAEIFGEASDKALVPYGQIWRTGANDSTTFVRCKRHRGRQSCTRCSYTVFTVPTADAWSLVISKKTGEWERIIRREGRFGTRSDERYEDVSAVENFAIAFDQGGTKCTLRMDGKTPRQRRDY